MSVYIVDASVAAKWFVNEEYSDKALSILTEENRLHGPDFLLLEMDSIILKWVRRGVVSVEEGGDLRRALRSYPIQLHPFPQLLDSAFVIAVESGQSIYDNIYVALAALLGEKMVTADRRLYEGLKDGPFEKHVVWIEDMK